MRSGATDPKFAPFSTCTFTVSVPPCAGIAEGCTLTFTGSPAGIAPQPRVAPQAPALDSPPPDVGNGMIAALCTVAGVGSQAPE